MQSKVVANYSTNAEEGKKARSKGDTEKQSSGGLFELLYSEAQTFQSIGEFKKAISSYSKALNLKPNDKKCLIARAKCYLKIGNAEKAFEDSNEIKEGDSEYVKSLLIKADALHQLAQFEYALVFYQRGKQLRPEMHEFDRGIQRAEEAIYNAVGDKSGIAFNIQSDVPEFCEELDIQKKLNLSLLAYSKTKLLERSETNDNTGGRKGLNKNLEERKWGDHDEHGNEKLSRKRGASSPQELEMDEAELERRVKMMTSNKSCKQLLGELYTDKEFLESLLNETEMSNNQSNANKQIRSLAIKELNFLGSRSEFWQQQKPLHSRKLEKVLKDQSHFRSKTDNQAFDSISEELKSVEDAQEKGRHEEAVDRAGKLLKQLDQFPNEIGWKAEKLARVYQVLGKTYSELGNNSEALRSYQDLYEFSVKNKMTESENKALEGIGRIHMVMGNFQEAFKIFQKRLKREMDKSERLWLMHEMGRCCFEREEFKRAEEIGRKCLEMAKKEYDKTSQMIALFLVGRCQEKRHRSSQALFSYNEALLLAQAVDDSSTEEAIKKSLGDLEAKVQNGDNPDEGIEDEDDEEYSGDDPVAADGEGENESDDDFSLTSISVLNSAHQMLATRGAASVLESAKVKKHPQGKAATKQEVKDCKGGNSPVIKRTHRRSEASKKAGDSNNKIDDDDDDYEVKKKQQKKSPDREGKKMIVYNITMKTGDMFTAGARSGVSMVIYGKYGKTEKILLKDSYNNPIPFEQGKSDKFFVKATDVGSIKQIKVFHEGTQLNDGWFLEEVKVTSPQFEEVYSFYVHKWLNKLNDDGKTTRTLEPTDVSLKPFAEYRVTLVSGGVSQLVNGINVFITVFGKHLKTDKMPIRLNSNSTEFSGESFVDKIKIRGTDVKQITKIRISLDNLKYNSMWLLERVKIKTSGKIYNFEADRWFNRSGVEGSLEGELFPTEVNIGSKSSRNKQPTRHRKLVGNVKNSSDDDEDDEHNDVCNNSGSDDIKDDETKCKTRPPVRKKEAASKIGKPRKGEKGQGKAGEPEKKKTNSKVLYTVEIKTGDMKGAGTDSNVFIILCGEKGTSSRFMLTRSSKKEAFQRGGVDVFQLECTDVGDISKIKIGHDASRKHPRWFVEEVKVSTASKTYVFRVKEWLDREMGDGRVVRYIKLHKVIEVKRDLKNKEGRTRKKLKNKNEDETVKQMDNDEKQDETANTDANDDDDDENNNEDKGRDDGNKKSDDEKSSDGDGDDQTDNENEENHGDDDSTGDGVPKKEERGRVDVIENDAGGGASLHEASYNLEVKTGKCLGAGTDANVFVVLEGDKGNTGKIPLDEKNSSENEQLFERGLTNHFTVKAKDVGKVNSILIGHDGSKFGSGWFLEDLNVKSTVTGDVYHFKVSQWLDKKEGDGKIERHLVADAGDENKVNEQTGGSEKNDLDGEESASHQNEAKRVTYNISVKTGSKLGSGTDASVYIILVGKNKRTKKIYLRSDDNGNKTVERSALDRFTLHAEDVGKIQKIIVGHDGEKMGSRWFLDHVKIGKPSSDELYTFEVDKWMDKSGEDKKANLELQPTSVEKIKH